MRGEGRGPSGTGLWCEGVEGQEVNPSARRPAATNASSPCGQPPHVGRAPSATGGSSSSPLQGAWRLEWEQPTCLLVGRERAEPALMSEIGGQGKGQSAHMVCLLLP